MARNFFRLFVVLEKKPAHSTLKQIMAFLKCGHNTVPYLLTSKVIYSVKPVQSWSNTKFTNLGGKRKMGICVRRIDLMGLCEGARNEATLSLT